MAAVLYWRLTALPTPEAGPLSCSHTFHTRFRTIPPGATTWPNEHNTSPTSPAIFETSQPEPDDQPVWAPPGSHPSTKLIGDIAVWRAARGIDPQDPRPTGGHQLEAAADLWKQHLDRDVARDTEQHNSNVDQRQAPRKAHRHGYDDIQRPYQTPRPSTPSSPGRGRPQSGS